MRLGVRQRRCTTTDRVTAHRVGTIPRLGDARRGVTLLELLVALTVIGSAAAVTALAIRAGLRADAAAHAATAASTSTQVRAIRHRAVTEGRMVTATIDTRHGPLDLAAYPDGSVVAGEAVAVERLTGRVEDDEQVGAHAP